MDIPEPRTYNDAINSKYKDEWTKAFDDKIASSKKNKVWDVVQKPIEIKFVGGRRVCKVKGDSNDHVKRFKTR